MSSDTAYKHSVEVGGAVRAAERIVIPILSIVGPIHKLIDLGGGTGAWCRAFKSAGVEQVVCLDHPDARTDGLLIAESEFQAVNLALENPDPIMSDLAVCVEFAEHVPPDRAEWVVDFLTRSAQNVVFSAAIPGQGGIGHVNEQWPAFWTALFIRRGFTQLDIIRPQIVNDSLVPFWYRQNLFLYTSSPERFAHLPRLLPDDFLCIHVSVLERYLQPTLRTNVSRLIPALRKTIKHRLQQLINKLPTRLK